MSYEILRDTAKTAVTDTGHVIEYAHRLQNGLISRFLS